MREKVSIIGLGWFGKEFALSLSPDFEVVGSKRSLTEHDFPFKVYKLDFRDSSTFNSLQTLLDADYLVLNIPPNSRNDLASEEYREMIDVIIKHLTESRLKRMIFVSSTGVFGENIGVVVEFTKPLPNTRGGEILVEAEERVSKMEGLETVVLRPSGLVGGERHPAKFLAGRNALNGRNHVVNLVHRNDLITITTALIQTDVLPGKVFHASATSHPTKEQFYQKEALKLGLKSPHFDQEDNSQGKEISSTWSKESLGISFEYEDPFTML